MSDLFSHAANEAAQTPSEPEDSMAPVVMAVVVPGATSRAFAGFTDHTHLWWPLETVGVYGAGSYVEFEEHLVIETADDGRTTIWGTLDDWQPPLSFHASWHPGSSALWSTELRVVFGPHADGTEVRIHHDGWEGAEDPLAAREQAAAQWPVILDRFTRFMGAAG